MRVRVWDLPVRLFHWSLAVLAVFSFATGKIGHGWMGWHVKSGYAILALLLFRLAWGVVGSDTARFTRFVKGLGEARDYARTLAARSPTAFLGHNPLGGWMVVALLVALLLQAGTGLFADDDISTTGPLAAMVSEAAVRQLTRIHSYNEWVVAAFAAMHVAAIVFYQASLRRNLIGPMVHGRVETQAPAPRIASSWLAAALFGLACAAVYYLVVKLPPSP